MERRNVVVFSAAPIAIGQEIEVEVLQCKDGVKGVRVRDPLTTVTYGAGRLFDDTPAHELLGSRAEYRSPRRPEGSTVVEAFRGRVLECVVSNVEQRQGFAICTSYLIEVGSETTYR